MALQRWYPFPGLHTYAPHSAHYAFAKGWPIPLDIERDGDVVVVRGALPGVDPSGIGVTIEDGVLTIEGETAPVETEHRDDRFLLRERRTGSFRRSLRLPESVDSEKAASFYENGVVTIRLPKAEDKKARRLTIAVADGSEALASA